MASLDCQIQLVEEELDDPCGGLATALQKLEGEDEAVDQSE